MVHKLVPGRCIQFFKMLADSPFNGEYSHIKLTWLRSIKDGGLSLDPRSVKKIINAISWFKKTLLNFCFTYVLLTHASMHSDTSHSSYSRAALMTIIYLRHLLFQEWLYSMWTLYIHFLWDIPILLYKNTFVSPSSIKLYFNLTIAMITLWYSPIYHNACKLYTKYSSRAVSLIKSRILTHSTDIITFPDYTVTMINWTVSESDRGNDEVKVYWGVIQGHEAICG